MEQFFPDDYRSARQAFVAAATAASCQIESIRHVGASGASQEALITDVAYIGPGDARKILVVGSGTHGVEGYCGSGCQTGLLRTGLYDVLPDDAALLMIHALNPHGFSHDRRVNEDNVDVNRNFQDFVQPLPENPDYELLHPVLIPDDWFGPGRDAADRGIEAFIDERGMTVFQAALTIGQYRKPDGLFYGGNAPCWSNQVLQDLVRRYVVGRERIVYIDVHTGLGPYGHGEGIFLGGSDPQSLHRTRRWFGENLTSTADGSSVSAMVTGTVAMPLHWHATGSDFAVLSLEFGTRPMMQAANALRADHWLYLHPDAESQQVDAIKAGIRDAFYVDESRWKHLVWSRFRETFMKAAGGFNGR